MLGGGIGGEGCKGLGAPGAGAPYPAGDPSGLCLQGSAEPVWVMMAGIHLGRRIGVLCHKREEDGKAVPRPGFPGVTVSGWKDPPGRRGLPVLVRQPSP